MRRLILCILALTLLLPSLAQAYDLLVLQSRRSPVYDEVLQGFNSGRAVSKRVIVLSDYAEVDVVRIVREDRPRLILAVGDPALTAARKVREVPVVALMSLQAQQMKRSFPNLTGIGMFVAPDRYITLFRKMKTRRVGVVYNPEKSSWYLRQAISIAEQQGITLLLREVSTPQEVPARIAALAGKVDALWMIPDTVAVTRETAEAFFIFSQQQAVPVVSFASAYLGMGATAALDIDRAALGRQARDQVAAILNNERIDDGPLQYPGQVLLNTSQPLLNRLGIDGIKIK